ncbi:MAG: hypothetical protein AAGJ35_03195 [Myxococcota bacterium]
MSAFLQSTAEQRRAWIEEAAGISRYKEHRKQAESNMVQTQNNLDRLNDLLQELTQRRKSLQRQANKARRSRILKEQIRDLDMYIAAHQHLEHLAKQKQLNLILDQLSTAEQQLRSQLETQEVSIETLQHKHRDQHQQHQEARDQIQRVQARIALLQQSSEHLLQDLGGLEERQKRLRAEAEQLEHDQSQNTEALAQIIAQREQLQNQDSDAHQTLATLQEEIAELSLQLAHAETELETTKSDIIEAITLETSAKHQVQECTRRDQELEQRCLQQHHRIQQLQEEQQQAQEKMRNNTAQIEQYKAEQLDLQVQQEELLLRREALEQQQQHLQTDHREAQQRHTEVQAHLRSLEAIQEQFQGMNEASRQLLLQRTEPEAPLGPDQLLGSVAEFVDVPEEFETIVAAALGETLQHLVVATHEDAIDGLHFLEQQEFGRTGFWSICEQTLPTPELPQAPTLEGSLLSVLPMSCHSPVLQQLLHPFILVKTLSDALRLRAHIPP